VRFLPARTPPAIGCKLTWREIWLACSFAQWSLLGDTAISSGAKERGFSLGIGQGPLEELDLDGALQPILFAQGGEPPPFLDLTEYEDLMTFREEEEARAWSEYAWDAYGHPHTSPMYAPWQLLYVDDVVRRSGETIGLRTLARPGDEREAALEPFRELAGHLLAAWCALDEAWHPLVKLLVRLQNRYLPEITGRTVLLFDPNTKTQVDPWPRERETFDAAQVAGEFGTSADEVASAYWFLVDRGIEQEPRDGVELLRRARPRSSHKRWQGGPRRAQDNFDAAQVLRLFFTELTGEPPGRTPDWLLDGRQPERGALYDRGPASRPSRRQLQADLVEADLYPHGVHIVGEGKSEKEIVSRLVGGYLGTRAASELGFTDLGGSGSASRLNTMVSGFTTYAQRTVVIVDSEGQMAEYVTGLIRSSQLPEKDALLFKRNLEESNFSRQEMLDALIEVAANPVNGRPAVTLDLPLEDVEAAHEKRRQHSQQEPGFVGTLLNAALDPAYGGPVQLSKPEFAVALADYALREFADVRADDDKLAELYERRPIVAFVTKRILPVLMGPRWG
jgi:hypothetical protein